jgi:tRNA dimethylallyltransferase
MITVADRRPVLIAGPTASGKSALALALAERDHGCVINADASQVYACWRVLTARPDDADLARAPHRLYGHVPCAERYSVGAWLREVDAAIADARRAGLRPIVVGGTGLYLHALTGGLSDIPEIPPEVRARSQAMLVAGELDRMLMQLMQDDRATFARIDRNNPMRVQRAWEVLVATGRGLSHWQREPHARIVPPESAVRLLVSPEISLLNNQIEARFHAMLERGALDEVRAFIAIDHDESLPASRVLGARELAAHLRGEIGLEGAIAASVTATRQFAKRQRTWFRNKMPDWQRLEPDRDPLAAIPAD